MRRVLVPEDTAELWSSLANLRPDFCVNQTWAPIISAAFSQVLLAVSWSTPTDIGTRESPRRAAWDLVSETSLYPPGKVDRHPRFIVSAPLAASSGCQGPRLPAIYSFGAQPWAHTWGGTCDSSKKWVGALGFRLADSCWLNLPTLVLVSPNQDWLSVVHRKPIR